MRALLWLVEQGLIGEYEMCVDAKEKKLRDLMIEYYEKVKERDEKEDEIARDIVGAMKDVLVEQLKLKLEQVQPPPLIYDVDKVGERRDKSEEREEAKELALIFKQVQESPFSPRRYGYLSEREKREGNEVFYYGGSYKIEILHWAIERNCNEAVSDIKDWVHEIAEKIRNFADVKRLLEITYNLYCDFGHRACSILGCLVHVSVRSVEKQ